MKVKFVCEYNGKNFHGFQRQSNLRNVQGVLEDALGKFFKQIIVVNGSGRTDVGVHAREQVCSFEVEDHNMLCSVSCEQQYIDGKAYHKVCMAVNAFLFEAGCEDVVVRDFEGVNDGFHARFNTKSKTYLYRVYVSKSPSPLREDFYHRVVKMPDVDGMRKRVKELFMGTRDFTLYSAGAKVSAVPVMASGKGNIRTISRFDIEQRDDEIWFWITGDGFLYKQVRLMIGQLLLGKRETVPAKGLTLWNVLY